MKRTVLIGVALAFVIIVVIYLFASNDTASAPDPSSAAESDTVADNPGAEEGSATGTVPELSESSWVWEETVYTERENVTPDEPGSFVLSFIDENRFGAQTDCNNVGGSYERDDDTLTLAPMMTTRMACMNETQEALFTTMLETVESVSAESTERLRLHLTDDAGYMVFTYLSG